MERGFLHAARLIGFRSAEDLTVDLRSRFVLLVGANGSGKSTVLDGLHLLSQQFRHPRPDTFFEAWPLLSRSISNDRHSFTLLAKGGKRCAWATARLDAAGALEDPELAVGPDTLIDAPRKAWQAERTWRRGSNAQEWAALPGYLGALVSMRSCVRLRLSASTAARPSYPKAEVPRIEFDGEGLPSTLAWLATNDETARADIESGLREIVPGFVRFRVPNHEISTWEEEHVRIDNEIVSRRVKRTVWGHRLELEFKGLGFVPADLTSEGTMLGLALLAILHSPAKPKLVLLDDVDKALHPGAQMQLVQVVRKVLAQDPQVQVVATTHSPFVLDDFEGSSVVLLASDGEGRTRARLLDEHPDFARLQRELRPGEFWSTVGEKWVLARP